jgi:uncharacterized membrane protein
MLPVVELRGGIPIGAALGLPPLMCAITAVVGNLLPIPFVILFTRRVFAWMRSKSPRLSRYADSFEARVTAKGERLYIGKIIGLIIFVSIPLPGTGAWTGGMIAALLNIRMRNSMFAISAGVIIAAVIVSGISFGFKYLFFG